MIRVIPNKRLENRVTIMYKGHPVASGIDFKNGYYEVIPRATYFHPLDRLVKMMTIEQIESLCSRSFIKLHEDRG